MNLYSFQTTSTRPDSNHTEQARRLSLRRRALTIPLILAGCGLPMEDVATDDVDMVSQEISESQVINRGAWGRKKAMVGCGVYEAGASSSTIALTLGDDKRIYSTCASGSTRVTVRDDWTLLIQSSESTGTMSGIRIRSEDPPGTPSRDFTVDWVLVNDGPYVSYLVGLHNRLTGKSEYRTLSGKGRINRASVTIEVGKQSTSVSYNGRQASFGLGLLGKGATKQAHYRSWDAPNDIRDYAECDPGYCDESYTNVSAQMPRTRLEGGGSSAVDAPAYAVAEVDTDGLTALGARGVRQVGFSSAARLDDAWRIGSNSKSFTGMLAFRLEYMRPGLLRTTVAQALGTNNNIHSGYHTATLEQILAHQAGIGEGGPIDGVDWVSWLNNVDATRTPYSGRQLAVTRGLEYGPVGPRGTERYSNFGILVAGAMIERIMGSTFESLLREHVLEPLEMNSCGFGANAPEPSTSAPAGIHGHRGSYSGGYTADWWHGWEFNAPVGEVYCSLEDFSKLPREHLRGEKGFSTLVPDVDAWRNWHAKRGQYLGIVVLDWGLWHNGGVSSVETHQWVFLDDDRAYVAGMSAANSANGANLNRIMSDLFWNQL